MQLILCWKGFYLAGIDCVDEASEPKGWTKWIIPGFEYLYVECEYENVFHEKVAYLTEHHIPLAGAVHDFTCPQTRKNDMFFPIKKL